MPGNLSGSRINPATALVLELDWPIHIGGRHKSRRLRSIDEPAAQLVVTRRGWLTLIATGTGPASVLVAEPTPTSATAVA